MLKNLVEKGQPPQFVGADLVIWVELPGIELSDLCHDLHIYDPSMALQTLCDLAKPESLLKISTRHGVARSADLL